MILTEFKHDPRLRASFNALARSTFGIDFESWYQGGHWDGGYTSHAWVEEGEVLATVGLSSLSFRGRSHAQEVCQIGTVMTHPAHRGRGLSTRLMEAALEGRERVFLLAHPGMRDHYPRYGFSHRPFWDFRIGTGSLPTPPACRKLDPTQREDMDLILAHGASAAPLSQRVDLRSQTLLAWHALNPLRSCFFHVPDLDLVFAGRSGDGVFHLFEVLAPHLPSWSELRACLPLENATQIQFHLTPDLLCPDAQAEPSQEDDLLFVRGDAFPDPGPFRIPLTAQA